MASSDRRARDELALRRVGQLLSGKWHLEKLLGVGGMAAVYAAVHRNGTRAAIKLFKPGFIADPGMHQRFLREGYLANRVGHPAVVHVFDDHVDERDGSAYLVMELISGESLQQWLEREGRLPSSEVLLVADQLLDVLESAHAHGIVHRDLKPENIIVVPSGHIRVLDFGIARDIDGDPTTTYGGITVGTPAFMAPEQALGKSAQIDGRTDLYAVGAMMFSLLTGEHIHQGETVQELVLRAAWFHARKLQDVWASAPPELAAIIDRACAYDRESRFADAKAMRAAVQAMIDSQPSEARLTALRPPVPLPPASALDAEATAPMSESQPETLTEPRPDDPRAPLGQPVTPTLQSMGERRSTAAPVRIALATWSSHAASKSRWLWAVGVAALFGAIGWLVLSTRTPSGASATDHADLLVVGAPRDLPGTPASSVSGRANDLIIAEAARSAGESSSAPTAPLASSAKKLALSPARSASAVARPSVSADAVPSAAASPPTRRDIGY
jgi:serine/threonine protein kinase